ncbi:MAG TPA: aldehyde ferredoxin oxidoreductase N-terminal domain-containing protein [Dehalococcoidia bacterium]|nr:aldehyde ferredoxin oxidoreductase N-terminal domain-containing protein [Dehalococcoidia bacterium]
MTSFGYSGKILRVDLSSGNTTQISTMDYADSFLGGRGIGTRLYWDEVSPHIKAFDAENRLMFMTGPLNGFTGLAGSRWGIYGKSPATSPECFTYCNLGGSWGAHLKFAGYDGIVIQGKSEKPVYLVIQDGNTQIKDASHLWGMGAIEARKALKAELGSSVRVAAIGPAGENLVSFAIVLADDGASGSGGLGAVMGAKKLKAIAVSGSSKLTAADPEGLREVAKYARKLTKGMPMVQKGLMPGPRMRQVACYGCIRGCIRADCEAKDGTRSKYMCTGAQFYQDAAKWYYGEWLPESIEVPFYANMLCDDYGVDTNSIAAMLIWLGRCYRGGILTDADTGMSILKMGSLDFIETLVKKISMRDGFGDILARGTVRAAESLGGKAREFITYYVSRAGHLTLYEPRLFVAHGLMYAMEPRQPINQLHEMGLPLYQWLDWVNKVQTAYLSSDVFRRIAKRFWGSELAVDFSTYDGKALAVKKIQDRQCLRDSLVLCDFALNNAASVRYSEDHVGDPTLESKMLLAVTGREMVEEELNRMGERIFNLQRAILAREGHRGRESDVLDESFYTRPLRTVGLNPECQAPGKDGEVISRKGEVVDRERFETMKDEYYGLRGWDVATGLQTKATLEEIGLGYIVGDLEREQLIA